MAISKVSSTVTIRSDSSSSDNSAHTIVVLPAWVAPETSTVRPSVIAVRRMRFASEAIEPCATRSSSDRTDVENFRMFRLQCSLVIGGMTTCKREPSGNDASTNGWETSTRRPLRRNIRSTRVRTSSGERSAGIRSWRPERATNTADESLIQISSTVGSSRWDCRIPNPVTRCATSDS